jgi:hypothetical protein
MDAGYQPQGYCPKCGYRVDPGTCPECGRDVPRPLRRSPRSRLGRLRRWTLRIAITAVALAAVGYGLNMAAYRWLPPATVYDLSLRDDALGRWAFDIAAWRLLTAAEIAERRLDRILAAIDSDPPADGACEYFGAEYGRAYYLALAPDCGYIAVGFGLKDRPCGIDCGAARVLPGGEIVFTRDVRLDRAERSLGASGGREWRMQPDPAWEVHRGAAGRPNVHNVIQNQVRQYQKQLATAPGNVANWTRWFRDFLAYERECRRIIAVRTRPRVPHLY